MLGERRSKAAFSAGFPEAVREETRQDSGHLPEEIMETEASLDGLDGGEETEENLQNDSLSEQTCEGQMHGKEDIWSEEEDIEDPLRTQKTGGRSLRTHDLFFASEDEGRDFQSVLQEIQAYLSKEYSNLVTGDGNEEIKAQIRRFAGKYIQDNRIQVPGKTTDALMERLQKKTGIKVTPHMLRHYFANARRKAGWKLELISQALGHRNIETTMRYLNISDQELMDVSDEFYRKHQSIYEIDKLL